MFSFYPKFMALHDSLAALAQAGAGHHCNCVEVVELAESAKLQLDRYFGIGNWYSSTLVRAVGKALADFDTEIPCEVVGKIAAVMRSAAQCEALRYGMNRPFPSSGADGPGVE